MICYENLSNSNGFAYLAKYYLLLKSVKDIIWHCGTFMKDGFESDNIYRIKYSETKRINDIKFEDLLNEEQYKVVSAEDGPIICIAGAGSGKTRVITYRVAYLLMNKNINNKVILLTFTNKAAQEMLNRVGQIIPSYYQYVQGGTFHHIALSYLRKYAERIGFNTNFTILDNEDSRELIELSLDELSIKRDSFVQAGVLLDIYGLMINTLKTAEDIIIEKRPYLIKYADEIVRIFIKYNQKKEASSLMDFDDILKYFFILLTQYRDIRDAITDEISYVLVDEFQDTTSIQAEISYALALRTNNILVVGDDAQSIYSFRGASIENMLNFPKKYNNCKIFNLNTNYRSTKSILQIAQDIISSNTEQYKKELIPIRTEGEQPWLIPSADPEEEAIFVVSRISELINEGHRPSEIAVLYRAHSHSIELQLELTKANIPFIMRSGIRLFEQAHLKDVVSFLRIIYNTNDEISFRRLIRMFPGIGNSTANKLKDLLFSSRMDIFEWVRNINVPLKGTANGGFQKFKTIINEAEKYRDEKPSELLSIFIKEFYYDYLQKTYPDAQERESDIEYFSDFINRYDNLSELFSELALISNMEVERGKSVEMDRDEYVILSTVHQAKGLEFQTVFVIGLADGMFPSQFSLNRNKDLEEERRLFYVAITRAKDNLFLSYPNSITRQDSNLIIKRRSRFLDEVKDIGKKLRIIQLRYEQQEE